MSYTMHSPSQGYTNSTADVYGSRAYAGQLMTQNYAAYINREDPYNGNLSGQYTNGPLQSPYPTNSSLSQATYPTTLPPISHFPNQQDVYSSCVAPTRNLSYPSTPTPTGSSHGSVPRHPAAKGYWNCESVQQTGHCYSSPNATHKTSPQAWSHSPNVMSSPSSTPSPIPGPSTPHHFASSPLHSQSLTDNHKSFNGNGIMSQNSSLPNNAAGPLNCNNPLQSLQKMVQIEAENNDIRVQYATVESSPVQSSVPMGTVAQHQNAPSANAQLGALESDPNYPTYYNLDQNRLCATPQSYSNIPAQPLNSVPFSPTVKSTQELRNSQALQNNCTKLENNVENGDLNRTTAMRFSKKLSKEKSFLANRSCSTETCSNGSPSSQSTKIVSIPEPIVQGEQTHDSVNSFRGSDVTANSRDSVKSTDSEAMSSFAPNPCSTPTHNSAWKLNASVAQSNEYRQGSFSNNAQSKGWWQENAISPSTSRSFTPHIPDNCAPPQQQQQQQYSGRSTAANVNFSSVQVSHQMSATNPATSASIPTNQSWSQSSTPPAVSTTPQMLTAAASFPDSSLVKKKRGRPFGSKNRRNAEASGPSVDSTKRKRKTVLVDIGVNTNLSFDVQTSLNLDDSYAFDTSVKHALPLVMKRKKVVGPVVRIDKSATGLDCQAKYSIVNTTKTAIEEEKEAKIKISPAKMGIDSLSHSRKNGLTNKRCNQSNNVYSNLSEKNWFCALCHKGPHYKGLGDLYGPYGIVLDKSKLSSALDQILEIHEEPETEHAPERRSLRRRADSQGPSTEESKSNNKTNNSTPNATTTNTSNTANPEEAKDTKMSIDVWIHEDCIVWSNNVYLEGTKIRNLEPAIVESFNNICTKCKLPGATLGCIYKNCTVSPLHYLCAKDKDCDLDEEKFILSCSKHKKRRISPKEVDVVEVSEATTTAPGEC